MSEPGRYRKKPVEIEAMRFNGSNQDDILNWADSQEDPPSMWIEHTIDGRPQIVIRTLEGQAAASPGWWVIRGLVGEFYPCAPDVFELTYEAVE